MSEGSRSWLRQVSISRSARKLEELVRELEPPRRKTTAAMHAW